MGNNKDSLWKLLQFIDELLKVKENEWFKIELSKRFISDNFVPNQSIESIEKIYYDLTRTKLFLRNIDKRIWMEGYNYYQNIKFPDLKLELIQDFKEMRIAENQEDIIEFTRRAVMQIENCLNGLIEVTNAYEVIKKDSERYKDEYNNIVTGKYAFFDSDENPKEIKEIKLPSKVFFAKQYYKLIYYGKDLSEMITIRNKSSHRGPMKSEEKLTIDKAKNNFSERKAAYFKCFDSIVKNLKDLYQPV
ncbi:MAG: hypothetical protein KBC43_12805 [Bacteroidales bacterium]|nr:hypothetical protein [Bacteroidales bacterium]